MQFSQSFSFSGLFQILALYSVHEAVEFEISRLGPLVGFFPPAGGIKVEKEWVEKLHEIQNTRADIRDIRAQLCWMNSKLKGVFEVVR